MGTTNNEIRPITELCFSAQNFFAKIADFDAEEDKYMAVSVNYRGQVKAKEANWWNIANCRFHVVRNPLDEIGGVFVLNIEHLFVHFFHTHPTSEHCSHGQVSAVARVTRGHDV